MSMQQQLNDFQPYLVSIRYLEGTAVIDVILKDGWTFPIDDNITKTKGNDNLNYYMLYSGIEGIGLDELLIFLRKTINLNIDREKKQALLNIKIQELKVLFQQTKLEKLINLKFSLDEDEAMLTLSEIQEEETKLIDSVSSEPIIEDITQEEKVIEQPIPENIIDSEISEEEREILEEEARAERNLAILKNKKPKTRRNIELPPKKVVPQLEYSSGNSCDCGLGDVCDKCI